PYNELRGLLHRARTAGPLPCVRPPLGDQASMPPQDCVRRHNARPLPQNASPESMALYCLAAALVIMQSETAPSQLLAKEPVLAHSIVDHMYPPPGRWVRHGGIFGRYGRAQRPSGFFPRKSPRVAGLECSTPIGPQRHGRRDREAERLGGLEVDDQHELLITDVNDPPSEAGRHPLIFLQ